MTAFSTTRPLLERPRRHFAAVLLALLAAAAPVAGTTAERVPADLAAGDEALAAGEYRAAAEHYERAGDTFPAAYGLALALRGEGRLEASLETARHAETLATTVDDRLPALELVALSLHDLAVHDSSTGTDDPRLAEATVTLESALALDDSSAARHLLLATVLKRGGRFDAMERHIQSAKDLGLTEELRQRFAMLPIAEEEVHYLDERTTKPIKIYAPAPQYSNEARRKGTRGIVVLQAIIDTEGSVQEVEVLRPLPDGLTQRAIDTVKRWRFQPATRDGKPVTVYYNLTIDFDLGNTVW